MDNISDNEARQKIWELIKNIDIALMVTHDEQGRLHARPMSTQKPKDDHKPFNGEIWFLAKDNSPKINEIKANPEVLLSYAEPKKQDYVSIAGRATVMKDPAKVKEFWVESHRIWFPDGPDDPEIALIKVDADAAEYWDSPSKSIVFAYGYFKARLTGGEMPEMGENRKVQLN